MIRKTKLILLLQAIIILTAFSFSRDVSLPIFDVKDRSPAITSKIVISESSITFKDCESIPLNKVDEIPNTDPDPKIEGLVSCIRNHFGKGENNELYKNVAVLLKIHKATPFSYVFKTINTLGFIGVTKIVFLGNNHRGKLSRLSIKLPKSIKSSEAKIKKKLLMTLIMVDTSLTLAIKGYWISSYPILTSEAVFSNVFDSLKTDIDSLIHVYSSHYDFNEIILAFQNDIKFQHVTTLMSFCRKLGFSDISIAKLRYPRGRPKESIHNKILKNIGKLKELYNYRLKTNGNLEGKIVLRFYINNLGNIIKIETIEETLNDTELIENIIAELNKWEFGEIDIKGDTAEVIYPFIFSKP